VPWGRAKAVADRLAMNRLARICFFMTGTSVRKGLEFVYGAHVTDEISMKK
jgi:hypothetical protein